MNKINIKPNESLTPKQKTDVSAIVKYYMNKIKIDAEINQDELIEYIQEYIQQSEINGGTW
jgi:hypothetical protein